MDKGMAFVSFDADQTHYQREYFVSHPQQLMFVRVTAKGKNKIKMGVTFNSLLKYHVETELNRFIPYHAEISMAGLAPSLAEPEYRGNIKNAVQFDSSHAMRFHARTQIFKTDGKVNATDSSLMVSEASEVIIAIAVSTSFNGFDKDPSSQGRDEINASLLPHQLAQKISFQKIQQAHVLDFSSFYKRVSIDLGNTPNNSLPTDERLKRFTAGEKDNGLVSLYFQYGRYMMISSSRTPEVPINLQGIWNEQMRPPWSSNYTININTEMNYWPVETTNLSEFHQPMFGFIKNLSKTGSITAKSFYGLDGWVAHHNTDIWGISNPVGGFGNGDPVWANWTMGGTWMSTHLWEHYLFTNDLNFLKKDAYPIMKQAALFCLQFLVKDKEGKLITSPSTSIKD
jgi:alpha-L-fucosidase 2